MCCVNRFARKLLPIVSGRRMLRAALVLCKQANDVGGALECYVRDPDTEQQALVFDYINEQLDLVMPAGAVPERPSASASVRGPDEAAMLKSMILDRLSDLIVIDQEKVCVCLPCCLALLPLQSCT